MSGEITEGAQVEGMVGPETAPDPWREWFVYSMGRGLGSSESGTSRRGRGGNSSTPIVPNVIEDDGRAISTPSATEVPVELRPTSENELNLGTTFEPSSFTLTAQTRAKTHPRAATPRVGAAALRPLRPW